RQGRARVRAARQRIAARRFVCAQGLVRMRALLDRTVEHARLARSAGAVAAPVRQHDTLAQRRFEDELVVVDAELPAAGGNGDVEAHGWPGWRAQSRYYGLPASRDIDVHAIALRPACRAARPAPATSSPAPAGRRLRRRRHAAARTAGAETARRDRRAHGDAPTGAAGGGTRARRPRDRGRPGRSTLVATARGVREPDG